MVAIPACGQLNRENTFPLYPFAPGKLVSPYRFGRLVPRQPTHSPHSRATLLPRAFRDRYYSYYCKVSICTVERHQLIPELSRSGNLVPTAFIRRHGAICPQRSSSNGCCLLGNPVGQLVCAPLSPHLL